MTGWLRVGLNVTTMPRPPRLGVQRAPWSYLEGGGGGKHAHKGSNLGGGWRGMVYGSQPIYPSGMPKGMPV